MKHQHNYGASKVVSGKTYRWCNYCQRWVYPPTSTKAKAAP